MAETKPREIWVDNVKVIACILVVLGHFFQSMTKANILSDTDLYQWFNQTIYYFHLPLFFICSGYLYQKLSKVEDIKSWRKNVLKKAINLGIPYFTFSLATWFLKTIFSSSTNDEIGGLIGTLFFQPASPYWYLYALFFIFLVTLTFKNSAMAVAGLVSALICKSLEIVENWHGIQAISYVLANEIWFVIGMCMNVWRAKLHIQKNKIIVPIITGISFVVLSVLIYKADVCYGIVSFLMGLIACYSIIMLCFIVYKNRKQSPILGYLATFTMPIFLMHTLFAASLRVLLLKLRVYNSVIHVVLGLTISFIGPILAAIAMKKCKWLEFFLYPEKFIAI